MLLTIHVANSLPSNHDLADLGAYLLQALAWSAVIVALAYFGSRLATGRLRRMLSRSSFQINAIVLLSRVLWVAIWTVGFLLILHAFGFGLTPLAAFVGFVGLAASLSLQAVLQNLVAGVYLLAEHPFAIGDVVSVIGPAGLNHEGTVEDIEMRTTRLRNTDGDLILIPNSAIFSGVVTNLTSAGGLFQSVMVTFPRAQTLEEVSMSLVPLLADLPSVLPVPQPFLTLESVGAESWTARISMRSRSQRASSEAAWAIARTFPDARVNETAPPP